MTEFRFHLEKYRPGNRYSCPACGRKKCFARYVDELGEITFPEHVGRCDHESKCCYHYSPKDFFRENPDRQPMLGSRESYRPIAATTVGTASSSSTIPAPSFIDNSIVEKSLGHYYINPLFVYLSKVMSSGEVEELFARYRVGTSKQWSGSTVFWQTDISGKVRTGKVMRYNPATGHRVKGEADRITWVHALLRQRDFNLRQCFFGVHLLARYSNKLIAVVESEKTALVAAHFIREPIWIATGGKHGCMNESAISVLKDRCVTLFPDLGAEDVWRSKLPLFSSVCQSVTISNILERDATEEQRRSGLDLADFLLMEDTQQTILDRMIARNPLLKILIDELNLVLVEEN